MADNWALGCVVYFYLPEESQLPYVNVRYGSLADILTSPRHVRFTPNSGHAEVGINIR